METKIKLCGMKRPEDIQIVNEVRPDYCGFIIDYPKSHRSLTLEQVRSLAAKLDRQTLAVGVFVDEPVEIVAELLEDGTIDMAQLHGKEDEAYIQELRKRMKKPLIQAFTIKTTEDVKKALASSADYILLDQGKGSGKTFDWSLIPPIERSFFLAGGLEAANLEQAIRQIHPYAVDLSSSLETDKLKDPEKMREAVKIVRRL